MSRVLAAVAVVVVLVAGGLWAASRGGAEPPGEPPAIPAQEGGGAEATNDAAGDPPTEASDAADAAPPAPGNAEPDAPANADTATDPDAGADGTTLPELGEGFVPVDPLVEERRTSFEAPADVLEPNNDYAVRLDTTAGTMVLDLYESETSTTVNNFVFLALHRYYDGVVFHRVLEDFMAQTGDPTGTGTGGPGYTFDDEIVEGLSHDRAGTLSMANAGPGTNGSQFFITFTATPWLDGRHTVFGRVVDGLDVLDDLTRIDPQQPAATALLSDPVATLRDQGIEIPGSGDVAALLEAQLGAVPVAGQSFTLAGYRGVLGNVGGDPAIGVWPQPDRIESATVFRRPR